MRHLLQLIQRDFWFFEQGLYPAWKFKPFYHIFCARASRPQPGLYKF